jgi:AraC-like DNA-binding protein
MWTKASSQTDTWGPRTRQALEFLREQSRDSSLDLNRTATALRLSPFHLSRLIKSDTGTGFARHLRTLRVTDAEQLLRTTNLTVKEVAAFVGYANTNALDRNFKAVYSVTPTAYRLRYVEGLPPSE